MILPFPPAGREGACSYFFTVVTVFTVFVGASAAEAFTGHLVNFPVEVRHGPFWAAAATLAGQATNLPAASRQATALALLALASRAAAARKARALVILAHRRMTAGQVGYPLYTSAPNPRRALSKR